MAEEITSEQIAIAASNPASATAPDGRSATAHSLPDQIAAARFLESRRQARKNGWAGAGYARVVPPGMTGNHAEDV